MKEDIVNVTFYFLLCLISMLFSFPRTSKFKPFTILSGSFLKAIISEFMLPNQNLFSLFFFSGNLILPCFSFKYFGVVICRFQNGQIFRGKNRCHYHFEGLQKSNYLLPGLSFKLSLQLFFPLQIILFHHSSSLAGSVIFFFFLRNFLSIPYSDFFLFLLVNLELI